MSYYETQIKRLGVDVPADLKLQNQYGETKWMTVSPEQIEAILSILNQSEVVDAKQ
jgi:hypothetical protein